MGEIRTYRDLRAWQFGMELTAEVYRLVERLPKWERFGLCSQMQRSSSSVPYNIAEEWAFGTTAVFLRHLRIARGSVAELETQIEVAKRVHGVDAGAELLELCDKTARTVQALILSLERKLGQPPEHAS